MLGAKWEEDTGADGENDQLIQRAQSIALATYTQQMDVVFSSPPCPTNPSPFTYVQIKNYHDALVANIMEALEQTNKSVFNQAQTSLSNAFFTELAIYQNKNELIVEEWAMRVTQATREAEKWYEAELVKQWGEKLLQIKKFEELSSAFKDLHDSVEKTAIIQFQTILNLSPSDNNSTSQTQFPLFRKIRYLLNEKKEELQMNLLLQLIATQRPTISKKPDNSVEELVKRNIPPTAKNLNENTAYPSSKIRSSNPSLQEKSSQRTQMSQPEPIVHSKLLLLITCSKMYLKLINPNRNSNAILQEVEEIPPYVQIGDNRVLVGKEAKDADIPNVTFNFNVLQLLFGKSRTVPLGPKRTLSVEEIIAGFFRKLKESIVTKSCRKIDGHAIIYPACLTNFQLRTLTIAAKLGGCTPLRTMSFHLAHAVALASQMSTKIEKIKKLEKILLIHMSYRTFEAIVANLSFDSSSQTLSSVSIESYASFEDQRHIELLQFQHLELIKQVQRGVVSENTQISTLHNYKQILAAAFNTTIHKDVYFIFEEKLESMAPILQKEIFKNKNVINVREIDVLREAELLVQCIFSSKSSVNNKSLHVSDVYTRSFGFWKPKIALADPSSPKQKSAFNHFIKLVKLSDMVKSLLNKPTDFMEAMDLIEIQVKNQSVPLRITLHEAAYDVMGGNRICEFILGSKLEQEVYSFEYDRNHAVAPFKLQVRLPSDDGLYTLHLTDQTGRPVELKNHTFRHLDLLIKQCTDASL